VGGYPSLYTEYHLLPV